MRPLHIRTARILGALRYGAAVDSDEFLSGRTLLLWMACETSSFPLPLSPVSSTLLSLEAAWRITLKSSWISGLLPIMLWKEYRSACRPLIQRFPLRRQLFRWLPDRRSYFIRSESLGCSHKRLSLRRRLLTEWSVGGDYDKDAFGRYASCLLEKLDAAHLRHLKVGDDQVELLPHYEFKCLKTAQRVATDIPLIRVWPHRPADAAFVINY